MRRALSNFRDSFAYPLGAETVRAFLVFGVLLLAVVAITAELAFRDLGLDVLRERVDLGRSTARAIAADLAVLGWPGRGPEPLPSGDRQRAERLIRLRMAEREFIHYVEVRDRRGGRLLFVPRHGAAALRAPAQQRPANLSSTLPSLGVEPIEVPLGIRPEADARGGAQEPAAVEGEVRLGISRGAIEEELMALRRSLRIKIGIAGAVALGLLALALFYVLHLIRKNRDLESARQSAQRASYVGLLASRLAHEIRNPLNAMNMNLQMLEEELQAQSEPLGQDPRELLESTKSEVKRLARLVDNFLSYARPSTPRLEPRDLNALARELVRLLDADFRQHGVQLVLDLEPLLPHVESDETQLKQAMINLLVNARQVLGEGGIVTLKTRAGSRGEVVLEVQDNGPGVPPDARERIFEVFYSGRGGGTGLGLPIAKQIVERHGGTIELAATDGPGTTFRIRLPRAQRAVEPAPAEPAR